MNTLWVIWWIIAVGSFVIFETYALKHPDRANTLSRFMYNIGKKWPLSIALLAMLFGGLLVHFYWNWCPDLGSTNGLLELKNKIVMLH